MNDIMNTTQTGITITTHNAGFPPAPPEAHQRPDERMTVMHWGAASALAA